ncbi:hypothetical protein [Oceanibaculum nanhaiense]|uniref:hypothetical protein n=1 Tax=Oceanibaculum nanhaiense TaxID=1909734 RepID=UPI003D2837BB
MFRLLIVALVLFCGINASNANPCIKDNKAQNNGSCWIVLGDSEKISIVRGIWVGTDTRSLADQMSNVMPSYFLGKDWAWIPGETNIRDISSYFDLLYKTPANRKIDWSWAYILASMNARDDDGNDRLSLLSFIRQHSRLPTYVHIVSVLSANELLISDGVITTKMRVLGTSAKGISKSADAKSRAILESLKYGNYYDDCKENAKKNLSFNVEYRKSLFDEDGTLTAELVTRGVACSSRGDAVPISYLQPEVTELRLGIFLLRSGLLLPSEERDVKWQKEGFNPYHYAAAKAKELGLYTYGGSTIPNVEAFITTTLRPK